MSTRRTLPLILLCLALLSSSLGCALQARETPMANDEIIALTVQAALGGNATQPAGSQPPTQAPPTAIPPTVEISVTPTLTPTSTATPTQTPIPTPCDAAQYVSDVTYPDDSDVTVNAEFVKTWRLRNVGTCTWTSGYQVVFDHGDRMSAPDSVMLTSGTVPPGSTMDVSVTLKAPADAGTYQGFFKLRNPSGVLFGVGADGNTAFWVKIEAVTTFLIVPLPIFPLLPIIQSSGTGAVMGDGHCFNLDDGTAEGCGSADADFEFNAVLMNQEIDPKSTATFSGAKGSEPSYSDCKDAALSGSDRDVTEGRWYCFKTSQDNYGWIKVVDATLLTMEFDWTTW
jgi:hypothetical protein